MRRDFRRKPDDKNWWEDRKVILSGVALLIIFAFVIGMALYSNNSSYNKSKVRENEFISLSPENEIAGETESASTEVGKTIDDAKNENTSNLSSAINTQANTSTNSSKNTNADTVKKNNNTNANTNTSESASKKSAQTSANAQENKEIDFSWPVKGDILKAFSVDNLLYSSTLQEWTVHNGVDIKADKTAVVGAAADGTVKSIKNDPRYGLTVIIEHDGGFKTIYSNLLTAEFVVEGEKVNKEQSIGTVGNSANFEVADESHLHFEILKNGDYVDPMLYLK
ncbi:MAG: M23 family metallopeptidase [Clostridia bacterium]|nr:M23 family metallopeptidase [Clostridia bacterium]